MCKTEGLYSVWIVTDPFLYLTSFREFEYIMRPKESCWQVSEWEGGLECCCRPCPVGHSLEIPDPSQELGLSKTDAWILKP